MANVKVMKFYADWCQPCRVYERTFNKVIDELGLEASYVNIDAQPDLASQYSVASIPTTVVLKDNVETGRMKGALRYHELKSLIQDA